MSPQKLNLIGIALKIQYMHKKKKKGLRKGALLLCCEIQLLLKKYNKTEIKESKSIVNCSWLQRAARLAPAHVIPSTTHVFQAQVLH